MPFSTSETAGRSVSRRGQAWVGELRRELLDALIAQVSDVDEAVVVYDN